MVSKSDTQRGILRIVGCRAVSVVYNLTFIATLIIQSTAASQEEKLRFEHLTVEQGLSSHGVWAIFQDSRGFMWFGTQDGLNKFDGYSFTVYKHDPFDSTSIPGNNISRIWEEKSGNLWLRGPGDWSLRFDRITGRFKAYDGMHRTLGGENFADVLEDTSGDLWFATYGKGLKKLEQKTGSIAQYSLSNDTLYYICEDPDEYGRILWIGTARGVDRFVKADGTFTHFEHGSRNHVNTICVDRSGILWIGTNEGLFTFHRDNQTFSHLALDKDVSVKHQRNEVVYIYEDEGNCLWVSNGYELFRLDRATETFTEYQMGDPNARMAWNRARSIMEDRRGGLWVGTAGRGVGRYDRVKDNFTFFDNDPTDPHSLDDNVVTTICEDLSGTLWFGTAGGGVNKLDKARKAFTHYTHDHADLKSLSDNVVFDLCEDRSGALWVATEGGLNKFNRDTETFRRYNHDPANPHGLSCDVVRCVLEDSRGMIWIGTSGGGLDKLDPFMSGKAGDGKDKFVHYNHDPSDSNSISSNSILSLFEDHSGTIWIGTSDGGLNEFDGNSGIFFRYKHDPDDPNSLGSNWVNAIYEDKSGTLWVGIGGGGLNKFERATGKFTRYRRDDKNPQSLSYGSVHSIHEDSKGTLWVGTAAGLNRFDRLSESFTHFTVRDGIASDFIGGILEDKSGCLWLKTGKGVSKFNPRTGAFKNYDGRDGADIKPTWGAASCMTGNGEMYFGGINGFVRFYPDSIKDNPYVPPIVITAFKVFDKPVPLDTSISEKKTIELSYRDNVFSFDFVALNYTGPEKNQYAYMLEGFDKDWVYCGTRRHASYTNLDGGTYTFKVKGSNNDGVWNETGTSIAVIITPPFWRTWLFMIIFFLVMAVLIGGTVRYAATTKMNRKLRALEQQQALERERLRISQDMHDEVGANLTEIAILSERVRRDLHKPREAEANVQKIAERTREIIDNIGEIIWAINPKNDMLDNLAGYLREFASEYFGMTSIECRFDFPDQTLSHPLSAEVRRNIFLTMKEAINNVVRHSGATSVELHCRVSDHEVEFSIQDNGRGFTIEEPSGRDNGLLNMKRRIEDIKGNLQIESHLGQGTMIRLTVPLA
jgi:signal transduction histidine kinase/ligand-binding sensor domain-containing protein